MGNGALIGANMSAMPPGTPHSTLRVPITSVGTPFAEVQPAHNESGFSLIELMIAIAVLTFGLVSIVGLSAYVSHANIDSNLNGILTTAAQTQVDQLRSAVWTVDSCDPALQVGGSLTSNVSNYNTTVNGTPAGSLIVRWQVAAGGTADYRYLSVNVTQTTPFRDFPNGVTISTLILRQ